MAKRPAFARAGTPRGVDGGSGAYVTSPQWRPLARIFTFGIAACLVVATGAAVCGFWWRNALPLVEVMAVAGAGVWLTERLMVLLYGIPRLRGVLAPYGIFGSFWGVIGLALTLVLFGPLGINFAGAVDWMGPYSWVLVIPGVLSNLPLAIILLHPRGLFRSTRSIRGELPPFGYRVLVRVLKIVTLHHVWGVFVKRN